MNQNPIAPMILHPLNNGYINSITPTINGTGEPGSSITTVLDTINYFTTVNENGTWSINIPGPLQEGSTYEFSVSQTNQSGTQNSSPICFRVDTKAMTPHTVTCPTSNASINTQTPNLTGTGKPGSTIEASVGQNQYSAIIKQNGTWNITLDKPLSDGFNSIQTKQIDMGNISAPLETHFNVDTVAPSLPIINKPVDMGLENSPKPTISGLGEAGAQVNVSVDDHQYQTTVEQNGLWNIETSEALLDDVHVLSAHQKDKAGNFSPENVLMFTVDTQLPNAPAVHSPANNQTIATGRPTVSGTGEANHAIQIVVNGKTYACNVDANGNWECKINEALPDGSHTLQVYQIDQAKNVSFPTELVVMIDTSRPQIPAILYPQQNGFVNASSFTVRGTGEPGATVKLKVASRENTVQVNADGSWGCELTLPDDHAYTLSVSQTNAAGSRSMPYELKFRVDADSLKAPTVTVPGNLAFLNTDLPLLGGSAYPNATVEISINGLEKSVAADTTGAWSLQVTENLPQGQNTLQISQNALGNLSPETSIFFQVKTASPGAPTISYPLPASQVTDTALPIRGFAEPYATLELRLDAITLSTTADITGAWMADFPGALADGVHLLLAKQTDQAGNAGPAAIVSFQSSSGYAASMQAAGIPIANIAYNPTGPNWTKEVIAVLTTDQPVTSDGVTGTSFSKLIQTNGIFPFDYSDASGTIRQASAAVSWIDDCVPVIEIITQGNYFSSDKTVQFYKFGPSGLKCALLNGASFSSGTVVSTEGKYSVEVCDQAGNIARKDFVIDKTAPTVTGVSEDIIYTDDVTIEFQDIQSGIANALLNGNPISSGTIINASGDYALDVYDHSGNRKTIRFQVKK